MLKNLVKKFKSHSLNEDGQDQHQEHLGIEANRRLLRNSNTTDPSLALRITSSQQHPLLRRNCCDHKRATCPHHQQRYQGSKVPLVNDDTGDVYDRDSGTESDEELEYIETNSTHSVPVSQTSDYYASQQSLSMNSCRSSHCGSPLLALSDQECNSWESIGSESGINLRATSTRQNQQNPNGLPNLNYEFLLNPYRNKTDTSTTPSMITEELPNHHYHTRQQFQRLKQQISMKNGDFQQNNIDDHGKFSSTNNDGFRKINTQNTAFTPFSRGFMASTTTNSLSALEKSPAGSGSSFDELEEINSNDGSGKFVNHKNQIHICASRRCRSSTLSTMSSSGVSTWSSCSSNSSASSGGNVNELGRGGSWSEKRKWSQMRLQQKRQQTCPGSMDCCCICQECGIERPQQRTVLHAARKTPVKLLYPLMNGQGMQQGLECVKKMDTDTILDQSQAVRKTRFSTRKKCRGDDETRSMDADDNEDQEMVKRPSLDFDKMRAKRVGGLVSSCKSRRSNSFNGVSKSKFKEHLHMGYHLRSTRRQRCLFRPLDPPITNTTPVSSEFQATDGNLFSLHQNVVRFE